MLLQVFLTAKKKLIELPSVSSVKGTLESSAENGPNFIATVRSLD